MHICWNGDDIAVKEGTRLGDLAPASGGCVAIVNGRIVGREAWLTTLFAEGDVVDLVSMVSGG